MEDVAKLMVAWADAKELLADFLVVDRALNANPDCRGHQAQLYLLFDRHKAQMERLDNTEIPPDDEPFARTIGLLRSYLTEICDDYDELHTAVPLETG